MTDLETGENFLHRDPTWSLPWSSMDELGESLGSAWTGYIGATAPEDLVDELASCLGAIASLLPAMSWGLGDEGDFDITVAGRDQEENDATWKSLAEELSSLLS